MKDDGEYYYFGAICGLASAYAVSATGWGYPFGIAMGIALGHYQKKKDKFQEEISSLHSKIKFGNS